MQYKVPIHVRHSFSGKPGTWVREGATMMERPSVVGVTTDRKVAKVTLLDVKDQPGIAAHVFRDLADAEINVRLIIQAAPAHERNRITFIIESDDIDAVKTLIPGWKKSKTAGRVEIDTDVAKIAIVGSRIASTPGLARADVHGARRSQHQHRLHQHVGDEGELHHRREGARRRRAGDPRRVLRADGDVGRAPRKARKRAAAAAAKKRRRERRALAARLPRSRLLLLRRAAWASASRSSAPRR